MSSYTVLGLNGPSIKLTSEGKVLFENGLEPDEAARFFWEQVEELAPQYIGSQGEVVERLKRQVEGLRKERDEKEALTSQLRESENRSDVLTDELESIITDLKEKNKTLSAVLDGTIGRLNTLEEEQNSLLQQVADLTQKLNVAKKLLVDIGDLVFEGETL